MFKRWQIFKQKLQKFQFLKKSSTSEPALLAATQAVRQKRAEIQTKLKIHQVYLALSKN